MNNNMNNEKLNVNTIAMWTLILRIFIVIDRY